MTGDAVCQFDDGSAYVGATIAGTNMDMRDMEMSTAHGTCVIRVHDDLYAMPVDEAAEGADTATTPDATGVNQLRNALRALLGAAAEKMTVTDAGLSLHITKYEVPFRLSFAVGLFDGYVLTEGEERARWPERLAAPTMLHGTRAGRAARRTDDGGFTLPLGYGLYIDHMDLTIPMENEAMGGATLEIALCGKSAEGDALVTILNADCRFSHRNTTVPATVDTTGVAFRPLVLNE